MERHELAGQVLEGDWPATRGAEAESLHLVSLVGHIRERELAPPTDLFGGGIVFPVGRRLAPELGGLRYELDRLLPGTCAREAPSECHQQPEWAIEPNLPPQQCPNNVPFVLQEANPCFR